jgi:hypothetical protein
VMNGDCTAAHQQNVDARRNELVPGEVSRGGEKTSPEVSPRKPLNNGSPTGDLACAGVSGERGGDERAHEQECHQTLRIAREIQFKHVVRPFNM